MSKRKKKKANKASQSEKVLHDVLNEGVGTAASNVIKSKMPLWKKFLFIGAIALICFAPFTFNYIFKSTESPADQSTASGTNSGNQIVANTLINTGTIQQPGRDINIGISEEMMKELLREKSHSASIT